MTLFRAGASYHRISKDEALDEDGVTRQGEDTDALAERMQIPIPPEHRFIDNDLSATHGKHRPHYEALMDMVRSNAIDCIIVTYLNRLWRNRRERADGIELLRAYEVSVLCVKGPQLDLTTATGRMLAGVLGEVDTFEVEQMSEREQREMLQSVQRGVPPTGPRPFGYSLDGASVVKEEAKIVRWMFGQIVAGATINGLTAQLNKRQILNRNGRPWQRNAVRTLLLNERYAALREYRGEIYPGTWPPIVEEEQWRAVRAILTADSRRTSPGPGRRWLLTGHALCGVCGMTVNSGFSGVRTYKCSGPVKHLSRRAAPIDAIIEGGVINGQEVRGYVVERLCRADAADLLVDESREDLTEIRTTVVALRKRLEGLAVAFADDDEADPAEFRTASRRLKERIAEAEARMSSPHRARALTGLVNSADPAAAWSALSLDRRQAVVKALMKVTILSGKAGRPKQSPTGMSFDLGSIRIEPQLA